MAVVALLLGRVDPHRDLELLVVGLDGQLARDLLALRQAADRKRLVAGQAERLDGVAV